MKLLLTSTGLEFENIRNKFMQLLDKPISEIKVIFVPTASRSEAETKYVRLSKQELIDLGIKKENIKTLDLNNPVTYDDIKGFDIIYVCGGNTFYLLKKVRASGFDKVIKKFIINNGLYFGVSAGSIIVCPDISIASPGDENDVGMTDFTGLNIIDLVITPHYCEEEKQLVDDFEKQHRWKVVHLTDEQALLVYDKKSEIIE